MNLVSLTTTTSDPCTGDGVVRGTFQVDSDFTSAQGGAATAVDIVGATTGGGGTIISIIGGASMLDLHALAMLFNSPCSSLLDQNRVNFMMYVVSPFYSLGNIVVVLGNMAVTAAVTILQSILVAIIKKHRDTSH